ncbi:unnamed protein product, partial [Discosporangium mesarthrocarpum]
QSKRTEFVPSTPSEIHHLLPSINRSKTTRGLDDSASRPTEPVFPQAAPIDRNLFGLYDPAFDPSPIGAEERGVVQPVHITRVVPHIDRAPYPIAFKGGPWRSKRLLAEGREALMLTIMNDQGQNLPGRGDPTQCCGSTDSCNDNDGKSANESFGSTSAAPATVDVYIQAQSKGFEHVELSPSAIFHRAIQQNLFQIRPPRKDSSCGQGQGDWDTGREKVESGLTILVADAKDWCIPFQGRQHSRSETDLSINPKTSFTSSPGEDGDYNLEDTHGNNAEMVELLFRMADGTPGPPRSAFQVQFEPGPLGMELEEDPNGRRLVQVRRVLQAGQAENDGRPCAGSLVIAVGDWGGVGVSNAGVGGRNESDNTDGGGSGDSGRGQESGPGPPHRVVSGCGNSEDEEELSLHKDQGLVRSLADFEAAILGRSPDDLFFVWMVDRYAPEAMAALGEPRDTTTSTSTTGLQPRSSSPPVGGGHHHHGAGGKTWPTVPLPGIESEQLDKAVPGRNWGALGWEVGYNNRESQRGSSVVDQATRPQGSGCPHPSTGDAVGRRSCVSSKVGEEGTGRSVMGHPDSVLHEPGLASGIEAAKRGLEWVSGKEGDGLRDDFDKEGVRCGWDFKTAVGVFEDREEDQALAARKIPRGETPQFEAGLAVTHPEAIRPLGLGASVVDEDSVFLWFSNNHRS